MSWESKIFQQHSQESFAKIALEIFKYQAHYNPVYKQYIQNLGLVISNIKSIRDIPFLPIELFKSHDVTCHKSEHQAIFTSSGTGGKTSTHKVWDLSIYEKSFVQTFAHFYGPIEDYTLLALLPSYIERSGSSLIYMCEKLMIKSAKEENGFYLNDHDKLYKQIRKLENEGRKSILLGVSFGLLDFIHQKQLKLDHMIVIETGGMKGRRKEMIREELHKKLCQGFQVKNIHSEYGMTELMTQAYSTNSQLFKCPPWMKVYCRDSSDPLSSNQESGALNIIDLANVHSCSFLASQDLGKLYTDGSFEVLGRMDESQIRGCNLMVF